jgi:hypothetical protein
VADRGYFNGEEIKACDDAGITVTLPKPTPICGLAGRHRTFTSYPLPTKLAHPELGQIRVRAGILGQPVVVWLNGGSRRHDRLAGARECGSFIQPVSAPRAPHSAVIPT